MVTRALFVCCVLASGCYDVDSLSRFYDGSAVADGGTDDGGTGDGGTPFLPTQLVVWAGSIGGAGDCNGVGTAARFNHPTGIAVDPTGTVYVTNTGSSTLAMIDANQRVTRVAGIPYQYSTTDGALGTSRLNVPRMATYVNEQLYFAESQSNSIRTYVPSTALLQTVNTQPQGQTAGIVSDGHALYVTEPSTDTIDALDLDSAGFSFLAGSGPSYAEGIGTKAMFDQPWGLALIGTGTPNETLIVADQQNGLIRGVPVDGTTASYLINGTPKQTCQVASPLCAPSDVVIDGTDAQTLYVTDSSAHTVSSINLKAASTALPTVIAGRYKVGGYVDGPGTGALFAGPSAIALYTATDGPSLLVADTNNHAIRLINIATQKVSTFAGLPETSGAANGSGANATFQNPLQIVAGAGGIFVADSTNQLIRFVDAAGTVSKFADVSAVTGCGTVQSGHAPTGLAIDSQGTVYVADSGARAIVKITSNGSAAMLCDSAGDAPLGNFLPSSALLQALALDGNDDMYVADYYNGRIQHLHLAARTAETLSFTTTFPQGCSDHAGLSQPSGLVVDGAHHLFVSAQGNCEVVVVDLTNHAATLFAGGSLGSSNGVAGAASFNMPSAIAFGPSGVLYLSDYGNSTIRAIDPAGNVTTLAGVVNQFGVAAGPLQATGSQAAATLNQATGLAYLPGVGLIVADYSENSLLRIY